MKQYGWFGGYGYGKFLTGSNFLKISICIVNLNAKKYLGTCLNSISRAVGIDTYEIIIVDNNSKDGSPHFIKTNYPKVKLLSNFRNEGYTRAINSAIRVSKGDFLVILNPDSVLEKKSIDTLVKFFSFDHNIGIVGPKVVSDDGSFQQSCRRGLARPGAVFSYFLGLAKRYPKNKKFTGYHLNHLDENHIHEVDGVSGSCMVISRKTIKEVGYFDERYFAYQEDSDYCIRAKNQGFKVFYNPNSVVKHTGGEGGSNSVPMKAIFEWHRSYYRYYFKHFSDDYSLIFNIFYSIVMMGKLIFAEGKYLVRK